MHQNPYVWISVLPLFWLYQNLQEGLGHVMGAEPELKIAERKIT